MLKTFFLFLMIVSTAQAGIVFDMGMTTQVLANKAEKLGKDPLEAGLIVCIAIAVKDKGLIHLFPAMGGPERWDNVPATYTTEQAEMMMISEMLDKIGWEPEDETYIIFSQYENYGSYTLGLGQLRELIPNAKVIMYGFHPKKVTMTRGALWYSENGKDTVIYGTGSTIHASSEPVKGMYKGRIY